MFLKQDEQWPILEQWFQMPPYLTYDQINRVFVDKQRRLRLVLSGAIEGMNYEKIRVAEPKSGVSLLAHGWSRRRTAYLLCAAASQGSVWVYEIVREASRHRRLLELTTPTFSGSHHPQSLCLVRDGDCLAVGFESAFVLYNIWAQGAINGGCPNCFSAVFLFQFVNILNGILAQALDYVDYIIILPHLSVLLDPSCIDLDPSLLMFRQHRFAARLAISVNFDEFLLAFESELN